MRFSVKTMSVLKIVHVIALSIAVLHAGVAWALVDCFGPDNHTHHRSSMTRHVDTADLGSEHHVAQEANAGTAPSPSGRIHCPKDCILHSATLRRSISYQPKLLLSFLPGKVFKAINTFKTGSQPIRGVLSPPAVGLDPIYVLLRIFQI